MDGQAVNTAFYRGNKTFETGFSRPCPPASGEVQIRIAYCGICGTDLHIYQGHMDARVGSQRVIGHEMSGTVEAIGAGVSSVSVGQKVVVRPLDYCGDCPACDAGYAHVCHNLKILGVDVDGAMQAYWTVPERALHILPDDLPLHHAALVEPVAVACHDVRLSGLQAGEDVVVIGGGPIGLLIGVVAKDQGANVTLSEVNPHRLKIAAEFGLGTVNPTERDLIQTVMDQTGGKGADVVFEVSGSQPGADGMTAVAATRGRIVMVAIHAEKRQMDLFQVFWRELQMIGARVYEPEDFDAAIDFVLSGKLDCDRFITDISPLGDVQKAFENLDASPTAMKNLLRIES